MRETTQSTSPKTGQVNKNQPAIPSSKRRVATVAGLVVGSSLCLFAMYTTVETDAFGLPIGPTSNLYRIAIFCLAAILFVSREGKPRGVVTALRGVVFGVAWVFLVEVVAIGVHFMTIRLSSPS